MTANPFPTSSAIGSSTILNKFKKASKTKSESYLDLYTQLFSKLV